jgi:hypothetical protein
MPQLIRIAEPALLFHHEQAMIDPRDGLSLFGPLDKGKPYGIRWGVIGPTRAIERLKKWVARIQRPVRNDPPSDARPPFPGFEATFGIPWAPDPVTTIALPETKLRNNAFLDDKHQRVFRTVAMFADRIIKAQKEEDTTPDIWCVVIPEFVYKNCRPLSSIDVALRVATSARMSVKMAREYQETPSLFADDNILAEQYQYDVNFHHQLKARLLPWNCPIQVIRETTIAHRDFLNELGNPIRDLDKLQSAIAWNISTAVFYKSGGRPWKLGAARDGVCYVGLVFKQDEKSSKPRTACCAAQMFLDSGDGVVFKGAVGPWYREKRGLFHLNREAARAVVKLCLDSYAAKRRGRRPKELFLHGRVRFNEDEWAGFCDAAGATTKVVGVCIRPDSDLKLFRQGDHPVLRGLAYAIDDRKAVLWTKGFIPRIRTYPGREVPSPLLVDVCRGEADIKTVLCDILALTKLNYNACVYGDGVPVTLKFANAVGEILTVGPLRNVPPLPFKYYI